MRLPEHDKTEWRKLAAKIFKEATEHSDERRLAYAITLLLDENAELISVLDYCLESLRTAETRLKS